MCLIFICEFIFLLIVFYIPLCNVRQPYEGCPFTCYLAEITWNETVWRMRTNNVKRVYCPFCILSGHRSKFLNYVFYEQESSNKEISLYLNVKCVSYSSNAMNKKTSENVC